MLFSHESNKAFLVPDYCRATVRNSLSVGRGHNLKRLERSFFLLLFIYNLADVLHFCDIAGYAQPTYIIHQYKNNLHHCETEQNKSLFYYSVSKALTNAFSVLPDKGNGA